MAAMYKSFTKCSVSLFVRDIPSRMLYESPAMADTLGACLIIGRPPAVAVVTADARCGSQRWCAVLWRRSPKRNIFLYLSGLKLTPRWFYKGMLDQLGVESSSPAMPEAASEEVRSSARRAGQERIEFCILGDLHLLEKEIREEFRFLLNYKFDSMSPGTRARRADGLWDKLGSSGMQPSGSGLI